MQVILSHHTPYGKNIEPQHYLTVNMTSSVLSDPLFATQCLKSTVSVKYVDPIAADEHGIHFPSRITVMKANKRDIYSQMKRITRRCEICPVFRDVLQMCDEFPFPSFPTTCRAFWASGLNQLSRTGSPMLQKADWNVTAETLSLQFLLMLSSKKKI